MSHPPLSLTARDFDAYAPEKATSNAYSRPRLEVKQRALAWARSVVARLGELGIAVDVHGSDEHPTLRNKKRVDCQWVFFSRGTEAREELDRLLDRDRSIAAVVDDPSPYTRHAFLGLRLDSTSVEVCFAVHPDARVDVDNLHARLLSEGGAEAALAQELMSALAALPDEFTIGVGPGAAGLPDRVACGAATPAMLHTLLERAADGQVPLRIGWSVGRETAVEHREILDEQLEDAIVALAPIYRLVAWSRQNDHIALERRIESAEQERARTHAEAEAQTAKWRAEQAEARRRSLEQVRARADERRPATDGPPHRPSQRPAPPVKRATLDSLFGPRRDPVLPEPAPVEAEPLPPPARAAPAAPLVIDKGAKVRVLAGPFADKVGVVAELDGRGGARVLLGLLSTRLELSDLEPLVDGRDRPAFQSSHRRPARDATPANPKPRPAAPLAPAPAPRKAR